MIRHAFESCGIRVLHVSTQDKRGVSNLGVLDAGNVRLALAQCIRTAVLALRDRPDVAYVPISQNRWGFVRDAGLMTILRLLRRPFVAHPRGALLGDFYTAASPLVRLVIRRTLGW